MKQVKKKKLKKSKENINRKKSKMAKTTVSIAMLNTPPTKGYKFFTTITNGC